MFNYSHLCSSSAVFLCVCVFVCACVCVCGERECIKPDPSYLSLTDTGRISLVAISGLSRDKGRVSSGGRGVGDVCG